MPPHPSRFHEAARQKLRAAIAAAGGVEVFAIGQVDARGLVVDLEIHCRGSKDAVPALRSRPRPGEVVIHNHPSGVLEASGADMHLAHLYGEDGIGVVITDNEVRGALWVVEPQAHTVETIDGAEISAFFEERLPGAIAGHEARQGQIDMAMAVNAAFNEEHIAVLEAGTGTGKSLAYLLPAVLWATRNQAKIAVATYTLTLQAQLASDDLPILHKAGLDFEFAVIKGRSYYVCRRKLAEAIAALERDERDETDEREAHAPRRPDSEEAAAAHTLRRIAAWAEGVRFGSRSDLAFPVHEDVWDQVASDHDQTLRARCPYFATCFYYEARRKAARAHVVVANHHLLLADLVVKRETGGDGILPRFDRLVLDEGHHLEDAATSLFQEQVSARGILRTTAPLVGTKRRPGSLARIRRRFLGPKGPLDPTLQAAALRDVDALLPRIEALRADVRGWLEQLAADALPSPPRPVRITQDTTRTSDWAHLIAPTLQELAGGLSGVADALARLEGRLDGLPPDAVKASPQPLFDVARARRRLDEQAQVCRKLLAAADPLDGPPQVRWIEPARGRQKVPTSTLKVAPVEVGPLLADRVFAPLKATVMSSATLTVGKRFDHFLGRVGLRWPPPDAHPTEAAAPPPWHTAVLPSPFDYSQQAILGLPRDLPHPNDDGFVARAAQVVNQAIEAVDGGVFVLCTSHRLVGQLHAAARRAHGSRWPLFRQGEMGRDRLLQRFRSSGNGVLFGTDSFWEGVSVRGRALRLVIIPRLPFRVPTEPVQQARMERLEAMGQDPFRGYALPQAVLRFRQGFGRLIRSRSDRGAVMLLDRRVHQQWYGRVFLASLPPLRRVVGPSSRVIDALREAAAAHAEPKGHEREV